MSAFANSAIRTQLGDSILASAIVTAREASTRPLMVGLSGLQGSGKSTLAGRLHRRLNDADIRTVTCSLDDFYLTKAQRGHLADSAHPLLATRGVPGTHDLILMRDVFDGLVAAREGETISIPHFDKARDDRAPGCAWLHHEGPVDVILLEGWCLGARPQPVSALKTAANELERTDDPDATWRCYVNEALAGPYSELNASLDLKILLLPPSFECVYAWRAQQEAALFTEEQPGCVPMSPSQLARFIAHYERVSRWIIEDRPGDLVVSIDTERRPYRWALETTGMPAGVDGSVRENLRCT